MLQIPVWFIPSFYGDIRLEPLGPQSCKVIAENLTVQEMAALQKLRATAIKKSWLTMTSADGLSWKGTTTVGAPIDKVAGVLARALKPDRKIISAVRFSDGTIEEIRTADFEDTAEPAETANSGPYRKPQEKKTKKPKAATSVARPYAGCPEPDFMAAEIKARTVLAAFLDPDQLADFRQYNRFVSVGQTSGHRYMITSRHANNQLSRFRTVLFDVDDDRSVCTHDWTVPAAEEMLALHIYLQLPGGEQFLRAFPGDILSDGAIYDADGDEILGGDEHTVLRETTRRAVNRILVESGK